MSFSGKVACSLKRPVLLPVDAEILSLSVTPGQKVKEGEVLGRYRLRPESLQELRRKLSPAQIAEQRARLAETDKNLADLEVKEKTLEELSRQKLAPPKSLEQVQREIKALSQYRSALREGLGQAEKTLQEERALLQEQLGVPVKSGQVPQQGVLVAPIDGHVILMHPELRPGAVLKGGTPVMEVGVMDPMLIRAWVHEIEAVQLKVGDKAEITLKSLPGQKFTARVNRLPWAPTKISSEQPTYYEVEFLVPNPDLVLKEGLKATLNMQQSTEKSSPGSSQDQGSGSVGGSPGT